MQNRQERLFYSEPMEICKKVFGVLSTPDLASFFFNSGSYSFSWTFFPTKHLSRSDIMA